MLLTLSGVATLVDYQAALRSVTYIDTDANPSTATRTITFQVDDGFGFNGESNTQSRDLAVLPHAAPVIASIESSPLSFTEGNSPKPITSTLSISSSERVLVCATVSITGDFTAGEDLLAFTDQNGISGYYDAGTGVLTLSGSASVVQYQAARRSVAYANNSQNPSTAIRTVTFQVDDGFASNHLSNAGSRPIALSAVNTPPVLTVPSSGPTGSRNVDIAVNGISVADVDANGGSENLTLSAPHGKVRFTNLAGLTIIAGANNSATMTVQGTLASLNAASLPVTCSIARPTTSAGPSR